MGTDCNIVKYSQYDWNDMMFVVHNLIIKTKQQMNYVNISLHGDVLLCFLPVGLHVNVNIH